MSVSTFVVALALSGGGSLPLLAQSIFTVVGGGTAYGRPAIHASMNSPLDVAVDHNGNLYITDLLSARVYRVDAGTGVMDSVAGNGSSDGLGDGGPATQASMRPNGITVDSTGNFYVAGNSRVRRVDVETGIITTVAGGGPYAFTGDGVPATEAWLGNILDMVFDHEGNLLIVHENTESTPYNKVRRVDAVTGIITTVAGTGADTFAGDGGPATEALLGRLESVAVDSAGNIYITDSGNRRIRRIDVETGIINTIAGSGDSGSSEDGVPATEALLKYPAGLTLDPAGNVYISDGSDHRIRKVDVETGIITTVAGTGEPGFGGDGGSATDALILPTDLDADAAGNLYIADHGNRRIRYVDATSGVITTVAGNGQIPTGDGGPAINAIIDTPFGIAIGPEGDLFISDARASLIRRVDARTGVITSIAGNSGEYNGADDVPATEASLRSPKGLALGPGGHLFVAESVNRVRRIDAVTGIISTVAGDIERGFSGDGGPATQARLSSPERITVDSEGNLYIADTGNGRIRRVQAMSGIITTVAGNGDGAEIPIVDDVPATATNMVPVGVALDSAGNLYIADLGAGARSVRRVDAATGTITTIAGGGKSSPDGIPAIKAGFSIPSALAFDPSGNLFITDLGRQQIYRVDTNGIITIYAGDGERLLEGDQGPATRASISWPMDVAVDESGNLYISDFLGRRVRAVFKCVEIDPPDLSSPANDSEGLDSDLRLRWSPIQGAFRYDVYLDTADPPQRIVADGIETETFSMSGLESLKTYYWRVVARGDPFCDPFRTAASEVWSFTTTSSCDVPGTFGEAGVP